MSHNNKVVFVTGATGNQGGAVARQLLNNGWYICGLTRNPDSPAALSLRGEGAVIVQGDLDVEHVVQARLARREGGAGADDAQRAVPSVDGRAILQVPWLRTNGVNTNGADAK